MSRGSKIIHIPEKQKGRKQKGRKHGIDSGLECAIEVLEQPRRTRGFEEKSAQNLPTLAKTYGVPPEVRRKLCTESAGNGIIVPS